MRELRVGVVGLGSMGRNHARVLDQLPGVRLVAAVDLFDVPPYRDVPLLESIDEFVAMDIDYAVVSTPTSTHLDIGRALAQACIPSLIEKPLALNGREATELADAFEAKGCLAAVGHIERYNAAYQQARHRIRTGELGEIYQISTRRQSHYPSRIGDVGVVLDLATHDIDITAWLTDDKYDWISARTLQRSPNGREDLLVASATTQSGVIVNHVVNWLSPFKERRAVITCERGTLLVDTLTSDLTFYDSHSIPTEWDLLASFRGPSEGDVIRYSFPKPEPLLSEHIAFRDAVLGLETEIVSLTEAIETLRVAGEFLDSSASTASRKRD